MPTHERVLGFRALPTKEEQKAYYDASAPDAQAAIRELVLQRVADAKRRTEKEARITKLKEAEAQWWADKIAYAEAGVKLAASAAALQLAKGEAKRKV